MRRLLQIFVCATLAAALTGAAPVMAMTTAAHPDCAQPAHSCHEATLNCGCCLEHGGTTAPSPALPSTDRSPLSKASASQDVVVAVVALFGDAPLARLLNAPSTHRAGPPRSLSILNATLLL